MKLYYSPGACSLSPHIALREAERTFELERVDLRSKKTASGGNYLDINPKGYVPALQLDGPGIEILTEGPAIVQYVADLVPDRGLAPANGTFARYHLQEWLSFISTEIHKSFGPLFAPDTPVPTQERSRSKLVERLAYTSKQIDGKPFVMGESFTVADCYLFAVLRWCERFEIDLDDRLEDYFHRVFERPAVQAALQAEGLLETKRHRRSA
ncbi:MAG TPA: glutathione transferase GstA [Kofleriaceae bacterium]|nr:glutathione transferase GstA [Kofleriaceae bacterium]